MNFLMKLMWLCVYYSFLSTSFVWSGCLRSIASSSENSRKICPVPWNISYIFEPPHDKINKNDCAPSEDSDQPGHLPSLIRAFAVRMKKARVLSYPLSAQRRLWSDWVDAQADLSLRWEHMPLSWFCHVAANLLLIYPGNTIVKFALYK